MEDADDTISTRTLHFQALLYLCKPLAIFISCYKILVLHMLGQGIKVSTAEPSMMVGFVVALSFQLLAHQNRNLVEVSTTQLSKFQNKFLDLDRYKPASGPWTGVVCSPWFAAN